MCTVEKFKFSEFLLDDKNATYLSSLKTISTLYTVQEIYFIIVIWADHLESDQIGFSGLLDTVQ